MAKSQNNETKDIRTKDGNQKFGHIHDDQVISSIMLQGQESLEFVTLDQIDPRKRWIWTRNRGRYQVISGDDIPEDQIAIYISSAGGNGQAPGNIEMFSKGTIKIQAENIELIATGTDNNAGNITLQGNQNIRLEGGKEINMDSKESTSISAASDLNLTATNAMKNKAGHIQQETAASALKKPAFPVNGNADFQHITGQLFVTNKESKPENLGRGPARIDGSSYMQGPTVIGKDDAHKNVTATLMVAPLDNGDSPSPQVTGSICGTSPNKLSIYCIGNSAVKGNFFVSSDILARGNITASGEIKSRCGAHVLSAKKNFDIPHPTKDGWRLTHTCVEGPEAAVYIRGRITNNTEINLPEYWKGLVDINTISVNLTPIGSHQDVIIKRWDDEKIYLQSKGGMPIDCFYHIMAERKDTEKLIPEYKGTIEDYPGDNSQRSIAGYHYDTKGE
jgi:hypothetical protein